MRRASGCEFSLRNRTSAWRPVRAAHAAAGVLRKRFPGCAAADRAAHRSRRASMRALARPRARLRSAARPRGALAARLACGLGPAAGGHRRRWAAAGRRRTARRAVLRQAFAGVVRVQQRGHAENSENSPAQENRHLRLRSGRRSRTAACSAPLVASTCRRGEADGRARRGR